MSNFMKASSFENTIFEDHLFQFNFFEVQDATTVSHWHKHMEFVWITHGQCTLGIDEHRIICEEGDVVYIPPGSLHSIECSQGGYVAFVIGERLLNEMTFDSDVRKVVMLFKQTPFSESMVAKNGISNFVVELLKAIRDEYVDQQANYEMMIKIKICGLMLEIFRSKQFKLASERLDSPSLIYVKQALEYIDEHYQDKITLKEIRTLTNLSEQHFSRVFKAFTGKTFMDYLRIYRLDRVNWYLKHTEVPITRIPERVGFCNANYMARNYKNQYGCTPRESRNTEC